MLLVLFFIFCTIQVGYSKDLGATGIETNKDYIHIGSALCSCSLSDGYYRHYNITFKNRCPNCGGKLYYEEKSYWVEGILACHNCDMDFCCVHGKSHDHRGYYLTKIKYPSPEVPEKKPVDEAHIDINGIKFSKSLVLEYKEGRKWLK